MGSGKQKMREFPKSLKKNLPFAFISFRSLYKRENEESFAFFISIHTRTSRNFPSCHVLGCLKTFSCLNEEREKQKKKNKQNKT